MLPAELARLAAAQGGPFTLAQARKHGLSPAVPRARVAHGVLVHGPVWDEAAPDPRHVLVLKAAARVLAVRGGRVSHRTAAVVHGLPLLGSLPVRPDVTRECRFTGDASSMPGVRVAALPDEDCTNVDGVPVVSLARTVVDVARTSTWREAVVVADAALRQGLDPSELAGTAGRCARWPGIAQARRVLAFADGRAETPLESITRVAYALEGLPPPETQVVICAPDGSFLAMVDFLWRAQRVVGEADGMGKYDAPGTLRLEKLREHGLHQVGFEVVRNLWGEAWKPVERRQLAERVRAGFGYSLARPVVPGVRFRTPTLQELRRSRAA